MKKITLLLLLSTFTLFSQKQECSQKVMGTVYVNASQKTVGGAYIRLKDTRHRILKTFKTADNAKYFFDDLKCNVEYKIEASKPDGYRMSQRTVITTSQDKVLIKKNLFLKPKLKKGEKEEYVSIGTVDFEYNEWALLPRYTYELDKAILIMKANPKLTIHFESHTDSRAPSDFNMELSEKRIEVLEEYVGFHEIFRKRITGKAFGETSPINKCVKGVQCTDAEYLENRRTTFVLKEKK